MKILLLSLFFIILIGLFYFLKKTPKLGIIHNPLREGVDSSSDCPIAPSNGTYNYDVNQFPQCQLHCEDGYAAWYGSNDGPVCNFLPPSNVDACSGCVKLNKDGTYTSAVGSCKAGCDDDQFCSTIATTNDNTYTYTGKCYDINKSPGNCVGTFKYINDSDCINGKIMVGKYVSDTGGMFGANCGSYAQNIFNDHNIFPTSIEWANYNKELIAFESCPVDCSGEWNNSAPSITECTDGYYTKQFISDPATPMNDGLSCMEIAKRNLIPINTGSTPTNIIKDANGNIIARQSCHIDCSGTWGDFTPLSCNPPVPSGTPGNTTSIVATDNPPNKITRVWTTTTPAAFEGSKSCLQVATDKSTLAETSPYIGYATDISSIMINGKENIKQNIYCKIDCKGDWIPLNDDCNDGKATLKWNISQNSSNGGLDCSAVAHKTQGDIYYYKSADGTSSKHMIGDVKCTKNNGIFDCYTSVSCPADCSYSFTEWTDCLDGKRSQTYNIHEYAKGNGKSCSYRNGTTIWENCTMPWKTPPPKPDRYITEAPCRLDNRPMVGSDKCSEKCVPYLPPYCENINQGVDAHGNAINGICCPFYDPTNSVNCQQCGTIKYHDVRKDIDKNIIKMYQEDNNDSKLPEWKRKIANLTTNSKNVLSDILKKII